MAGKVLRRWIPALVLVLVVAAFFWWARPRRAPPDYPMAYVVESSAILWNSNAQVRQPVATLHYGDHVTILQRGGERVSVRSDGGVTGWVDESALMDAALWEQAAMLLARAKDMPVQARGHTRTISNVRLTPGRDGARIVQFGRDEPVAVLERATSAVATESEAETKTPAAQNLPKMEDWLLVLRAPQAPAAAGAEAVASRGAVPATATDSANPATPVVPVAGWILARFIELNPPAPIPDYFSASNLRVVAWATVNMGDDNGTPKPQYLVAGIKGGEGQTCDFTLLRFYTWGAKRQRYETAFVENDICGRMPIRVTAGAAESRFSFADPAQNGAERSYRVRQTSVRRVTGVAAAVPRSTPLGRKKK